MSNKRSIILAGVVMVLLGGLAWAVLHSQPSEPVYQGKRLSEWVNYFYLPDTGTPLEQAKVALSEAGTNAFPTLFRMLRAHDSPMEAGLFTLAKKQHLIKIQRRDPATINLAASLAFQFMGGRAASAVPELIKIFEQKVSLGSQRAAGYSLAGIGPEAKAAVPALLREAGNTNDLVRDSAFDALAAIHADPDAVVPVFIQGLKDPYLVVQYRAALGLGNFGPEAKAAVPALVELIKKQPPTQPVPRTSGLPGMGTMAAEELKKIDPEAAAKLMKELNLTW